MLENKVIIYDDSCPMCKLYTYWFIAWGFLAPGNRIGFAAAPAEITSRIDLVRGRHEIPLFDRATGETIYGLKALTTVLGSRWTWLNPLLQSRALYLILYPLYQIITYNRRVIAGCRACNGFDCAPDLNRFYRSVYLALAATAILAVAALLLADGTTIASAAVGMIAAFSSVGLIAGGVIRVSRGAVAGWDYAGNYVTTLLIVTAVMLPVLILPSMAEGFAIAIIGAASLLGLAELRRREI